jgi:hypothetical protein
LTEGDAEGGRIEKVAEEQVWILDLIKVQFCKNKTD